MVTLAPSNTSLFSLAPGEKLTSIPLLTHTGREQPGILPEELAPQRGEINIVEMNCSSGTEVESPSLVKSGDNLDGVKGNGLNRSVCDRSQENVTAVTMDDDKRRDDGVPVTSSTSR